MDVMSLTTRIADVMPLQLTSRLRLNLQADYFGVSPTVGEVRARLILEWTRAVETLAQDEDGEWDWQLRPYTVTFTLLRLPGRKLVELWDHRSERWLTGPVSE